MNAARLAGPLLLVLATGCPDGKAPPPAGTPPPATTAAPGSTGIVRRPREGRPAAATTTAAPAWADDPDFARPAIAEVYRADVLLAEAERRAVHAKHGLANGAGIPVPARIVVYERALKRFAAERPLEWADLVAEVEQARAKAEGRASVEGGR